MLNFRSLYSGSSGNSLFVETENTKILVDAGMSCKKIEEALHSVEVNPSSINAIKPYAFKFCYVKKITMHKDVTSIGKEAFYGCKSLKKKKNLHLLNSKLSQS